MKIKELNQKDDKALIKLADETRAKLVKDRFKIASRETNQVSEIKKSRRMIARINTILRARKLVTENTEVAKKAAKATGDNK